MLYRIFIEKGYPGGKSRRDTLFAWRKVFSPRKGIFQSFKKL